MVDDEALMATQENMNTYESTTLADVIDNIKAGGKKYYRFYPLLLDKHPEHIRDFDYNWLLSNVKHGFLYLMHSRCL